MNSIKIYIPEAALYTILPASITRQILTWFSPTQLCFIQQLHVSVEVNHHQAINTKFKKKVKTVMYYIILFMFLWDPTSFPIFYNKL